MISGIPDAPGFEFWRIQIERLGERDPIDVLASTPDDLSREVAAHAPARFTARPAPDKWCAAEILGHLVDIEFVFGYRVRTILADATPEFGGIDQDRWVTQQEWRHVAAVEIVRHFGAVREVNVDWWRSVPADAMSRTGRHTEAGVDLSLELMLHVLAGHDLVHLDQLRRALDAG